MSYIALDQITYMFQQVFGSPFLIGMIILVFFLFTLIFLRTSMWVVIIIIFPVAFALAFSGSVIVSMSGVVPYLLLFVIALGIAMFVLLWNR